MSAELPSAGRYEIVEKIGAGGMGSVYRANDPVIGRSVAVKAIVFDEVPDPKERRDMQIRTAREARSAGMLSHPNIVTVHDIGQEGGLAYIVMELVDGSTLWELFCRKGKLGKSELLSILKQSASALDYAHEHGVIHRDVKPSNILVRPDGVAKLTDFGVAKILAAEQLTRTGLVVGTPNYMAPEQVKEQNVSPASDQFGLAVIAYELLTGRKPFDAGTFSALLYKIMAEAPPPAIEANPNLPRAVEETLERALAKEPEQRYASCSAFASALEQACADLAEDGLGERYQPAPEPADEEPEADEVARLSLDQLRKVETSAQSSFLPAEPAPAEPAPSGQADSSNKTLLFAAAGVLVVALAAGALFWGGGGASPEPAPKPDDPPMVIAQNPPPDGPEAASPASAPPEASSPQPAAQAPAPASATGAASPPPQPASPSAVAPSAVATETPLLVGATTTIVWRGQLDPGAELRIEGDQASIGEISRGLPGEPVQVEVSPNVLEILEAPSPENGWNLLRLRNGEDRARRYFLIRCRAQ